MAQKSLDFQSPPLFNGPCNGFARIKIITSRAIYISRYINSQSDCPLSDSTSVHDSPFSEANRMLTLYEYNTRLLARQFPVRLLAELPSGKLRLSDEDIMHVLQRRPLYKMRHTPISHKNEKKGMKMSWKERKVIGKVIRKGESEIVTLIDRLIYRNEG